MSQWRRARPEVITAAIFLALAAIAGYALAGWPGLAVVATVTAALTLAVLRGLAPRPAPQTTRKAPESDSATMRSITGFSQRRFVVASGISSREFYEADLRPALQHLLAARLAERHGLNLYTEPAAAKRAFVRSAHDEALWRWIDPAGPSPGGATAGTPRGGSGETFASGARGIPRRTLARLIDRLEHL
jgi:hypothetical protein